MKTKLASCVVIGSLLLSTAAFAEDRDTDRTHPGAFVKDSVITTKIKAKLAAEKVESLAHVKVDTDAKGAVVLSGTVRNQEQLDKAVSIANSTKGVTSVQNNLTIKVDG